MSGDSGESGFFYFGIGQNRFHAMKRKVKRRRMKRRRKKRIGMG